MGSATRLWDRPVRDFPTLVHLVPPVSHAADSIADVVATLSRDAGAGSAFVVDEQDHLVGVISERVLDTDLLTMVLPQDLWPELMELDTRDLMRVSRGKARTARDLMSPAKHVTADTPIKDVLAVLTRAGQTGVALVDDEHRLLGYLSLFEVLAELLRQHG
ncbi:MAG: CBS domain-containing protein [Chloroflexota bacterium]